MSQDLLTEIDEAVASALSACGRAASWRAYSGEHQIRLANSLEELGGCEHVGLTCSGTAALENLLKACRLELGEEVLLAGYDYPGNFATIERVGGRPALVDVDKDGWNLCWESLNATYTPACRALIASHLHGQLQPIAALHAWCRQRKVWLIQDACQALGATIAGQPLGRYGDATVVSFGGSKVISGGRGGAWITANGELAQRARRAAGVGSGAYELSELQAVAINAQLPFLSRLTAHCRSYFEVQRRHLEERGAALVAPWQKELAQTAFYQAGYLVGDNASLRSSQASGTGVDSLRESPLVESPLRQAQPAGLGSGFSGYHRRSNRRCRIQTPLRNTQRVAARTFTVHHRVALQEQPLAEQVLAWLASHQVT